MKRVFKVPGPGGNNNNPSIFAWQASTSTFLASSSYGTSSVSLMDRKGTLVATIPITGECIDIKWSPDGACIAILQSKSTSVILWDVTDMTKPATQIDTNMKNMEVLAWSSDSETLAVATSKGNLFLYSRRTGKKVPVIGKHTKTITNMQWSSNNDLACASTDKSFTISNHDGDTTHQVALKGDPSLMQWKITHRPNGSHTQILTMVINSKTLYMFDPLSPQQPTEITFNPRYGTITNYHYTSSTNLVIGFATGYVIAISTSQNDIGKELFQSKSYKDTLSDIRVSRILNTVATCGDSVIKLHDMHNLHDVSSLITLENERGSLHKLEFSDDGQFLTVGTKDGSLYTYLSRLAMLSSVHQDRVAHLVGITEVAVTKITGPSSPSLSIRFDAGIEPQFIVLGPTHVVVGAGSKARFYPVSPSCPPPSDGIAFDYTSFMTSNRDTNNSSSATQLRIDSPVWDKDYTMAIKQLATNKQYVAVLLDSGELHLHPLESDFFNPETSSKPPLTMVFPESPHTQTKSGDAITITCVAMTHDFMIYGTQHGSIIHYDMADIVMVNEYQHTMPITSVHVQPGLSTKILFTDSRGSTFIMSPTSETVIEVPSLPSPCQNFIWETNSYPGRNVFLACTETGITTYVYSQHTIKGPQCLGLHSTVTKLPYGYKPVMCIHGTCVCQTPAGKLDTIRLSTHDSVSNDMFTRKHVSDADQGRVLRLMYVVGNMSGIWSLGQTVTSRRAWTMLAEAALHSLDITTAKRVYRQMLADAGMVMTLTRIESIEDRTELQGHIAVIFGDFALAQQCFLTCSNPKEALYLRRDLMDWDQALSLATRMAPGEIAVIAREYALQLEMDGKAAEALAMYERALATPVRADMDDDELADHDRVCRSGLLRTVFRTGDLTRGMALVTDITDRMLLLECASILESLKQLTEAAVILERGSMWERAAELWIRLKSWSKVGKIIDKLNSTKIFLQYARAKEAEGQYLDAASAFERAKDYDNVARVLVERLGDIEGAVLLVRKTRSRESSKLMAKAFLAQRDYKPVVEFYLMAGMPNEAFDIAKSQDIVDYFAELVHEEASNELLTNMAVYFESKGMYVSAGRCHLQASHYPEALKMFLQSPVTDGVSIELAIDTVGQAKNDALTHELIDFLMGETDGIPKDAKYIFKLYMSLGQFREAARTAIIIAREEQVLGNYRAAHDLLYDNYRQLKVTKVKVPAELDRMLMILHSYTLVKTLVRIDDHVNGARMLMRVSNNISKFPAHVVPILTSTVVECHRAGFKKAAFEYAAMLMRPEYRSKVDAKFKRKIEQIVRRPEKDAASAGDDGDGSNATGGDGSSPENESTPCPFCGTLTAVTVLDCDVCKNHIPYCIATGHHMTLQDWSRCPHCEFPALATPFKTLLEKTGQCPMCGVDVAHDAIVVVDDAEAYLRGKKNDVEEGGSAVQAGGMASAMGAESVRKSTNQ